MKFYSFYVDKDNPSRVMTPISHALQTVIMPSKEEEEALVCLMKLESNIHSGHSIQIVMTPKSKQKNFKEISLSSEDKRLFISKIWESLEKQLETWKGWI